MPSNPDPALSRERLDQIRETLWPTRHTYCAEPLDIEDARYLLAAVDALQQQIPSWQRIETSPPPAVDQQRIAVTCNWNRYAHASLVYENGAWLDDDDFVHDLDDYTHWLSLMPPVADQERP